MKPFVSCLGVDFYLMPKYSWSRNYPGTGNFVWSEAGRGGKRSKLRVGPLMAWWHP